MKRILLVIALLLGSSAAHSQTINNLTSGSALTGTEQLPMFQSANPAVTTTPNAFKTFLNYSVFGGGVSITAGCGNTASGGSITSQVGSNNAGIIASQLVPIATSSTAFPITSANCGQLIAMTNTTAGVISIPQAGSAGFPSGTMFEVCDYGTGTNAITPAAGTIAGQSSYALGAGTTTQPVCVGFTSDGVSDYRIIASGSSNPGNVFGPASSTAGDLAAFTDTTGKNIGDGGIATSSIVIGPSVAVSGDVMVFSSTTGKAVGDQTSLQVASSGGAGGTGGNIAVFRKRIQVTPRSATTPLDFIFSTSDYFVCAANPSAQATEVMPSSPATGDTYLIKDCNGKAATHPINMLPASGLIDGAASYAISTAYGAVALTYTGFGWMSN